MKWSQEIDFKIDEVNKLKDKLDGYKTELNFVALNKGFGNLYTRKAMEAASLLRKLQIMGALLVLPLGIKIMDFLSSNKEESTAKLLAKSADGIAVTAQSLSNSADAVKTTAQSLANSVEDITSIANSLSSSSDFKSFGLLLSILSLELILIYFFRIILSNYKSVQAQIVQIELRQTLCEFIQGYADYRNILV